jgi:hypothetical protein
VHNLFYGAGAVFHFLGRYGWGQLRSGDTTYSEVTHLRHYL